MIINHYVYIGQLSTGKSMQDIIIYIHIGGSVLGYGAKAIINFFTLPAI